MNKIISRFWEGNRLFTMSFVIGLTSSFLMVAAVFYFLGIRLNVTRSFPLGFYRICDGNLERGDLVFLEPPENDVVQWGRATGAISRATIIKRIYGMEGDEVEVSLKGVRINGSLIENSKVLEEKPDGTPIPSIAKSGVILPERVWVMSEYSALSFDSRYFGTVPIENIKYKAKPLWVW